MHLLVSEQYIDSVMHDATIKDINKSLLDKYCFCVRLIRAGTTVCSLSDVTLLDLNYSYSFTKVIIHFFMKAYC